MSRSRWSSFPPCPIAYPKTPGTPWARRWSRRSNRRRLRSSGSPASGGSGDGRLRRANAASLFVFRIGRPHHTTVGGFPCSHFLVGFPRRVDAVSVGVTVARRMRIDGIRGITGVLGDSDTGERKRDKREKGESTGMHEWLLSWF